MKNSVSVTAITLLLLLPLIACAQYRATDATISEEVVSSSQPPNQPQRLLSAGIDILPAENTTSARLKIKYGYRLAPRTTASVGTGFTFYHDPLSLVPLFVNLAYDITDAPSLFFIAFKAGYNISILTDTDTYIDDHDGGYLLNPSIGMNIPTEYGFSLTLRAGYSIEKASFSRKDSWRNRTFETNITYKRLMAGAGFTF